jgi:PrtD family type I secretion system ABC transporter
MDPRPSTTLGFLLARCRGGVAAAAAIGVATNLLTLVVSIYSLQVYDRVLPTGSAATLVALTLLAVGAMATACWLDALRGRILMRIAAWLDAEITRRLTASLVDRALEGDGYRSEGLRDAVALRGFLSGAGLGAFLDLPFAPVYAAFLYLMHPLLGHILIVGAAVLFGLALINDRLTRGPLARASALATAAARDVEAALTGAEAIDAMGMAGPLGRRWAGRFSAATDLQIRASDRAGILLALIRGLRMLIQVLVIAAGAWAVMAHEAGPGVMVAGSLVIARALAPVEQVVAALGLAQGAAEALRRLDQALSASARRPAAMALPPPVGRLALDAVGFTPTAGAEPVLDGISFEVSPGEVLGVVGPSAAGKSTLARLLAGVVRPTAGHVRLDGGEMFARDRAEIGAYVGYLPQDVQLLPGSIAENIARFADDVRPELVVEAARRAGIHEAILRLPEAYATIVGPGSAPLSGGQRQLVGLARALYGTPRLLVLDEPNANLDAAGEAMLARAVAGIKALGGTVVVIGHRPAIFAQVDKLLVLEAGRVAAFGPRTAVVAQLKPAVRPAA